MLSSSQSTGGETKTCLFYRKNGTKEGPHEDVFLWAFLSFLGNDESLFCQVTSGRPVGSVLRLSLLACDEGGFSGVCTPGAYLCTSP